MKWATIIGTVLLVTALFSLERKKPEPNEPLLKIETEVTDNWLDYAWKCSCGVGFSEMLSIQCLCGKEYNTFEILMKNIPTWPDYIELEKDLVFDYGFFDHVRYPKGTKIYFKD